MKTIFFAFICLFTTLLNMAEEEKLSQQEKEQQVLELVKKYVESKQTGPTSQLIFSDQKSSTIKLQNDLEKPINIEWEDKSLKDCFEEFRELSQINIVIHKDLVKKDLGTITIKLKNISTKNALKWILRNFDVKATLIEGVIMIHPKEIVMATNTEVKMIDITDLTIEIRDFPADEKFTKDAIK